MLLLGGPEAALISLFYSRSPGWYWENLADPEREREAACFVLSTRSRLSVTAGYCSRREMCLHWGC